MIYKNLKKKIYETGAKGKQMYHKLYGDFAI